MPGRSVPVPHPGEQRWRVLGRLAGWAGSCASAGGAPKAEPRWPPQAIAFLVRSLFQERSAHGGSCPRSVLFLRLCSSLSWLAQNSRYSKLEKADILEMTVRFLKELPVSTCLATAPGE